jgi:hypothetical protein
MNYVVVTSWSVTNFEQSVMNYLKDGWRLQGGVSLTINNGETIYAQAMIKGE